MGITFKQGEDGIVSYHEVMQLEQAELVSPQQFVEIIDIFEEAAQVHLDLTQVQERRSLKYITSTLSTIAQDIRSLPGSIASQGKDETLCGLIYYYYKDRAAGHLANFYRDTYGNLFFVDAQSEFISDTPPTEVLGYELKGEVFFYALAPSSGFFIKKEPGVSQLNQIAEGAYIKSEGVHEHNTLYRLEEEPYEDLSIDEEQTEDSSTEEDIFTDDSDDSFIGRKRKYQEKKSYKCDYPECTKAFAQSGDLKRHKRTHTGEKPYICDYPKCNKAFNRTGHLTQHKITHTGEKPYICDYPECNKAFGQPNYLARHKKRIHIGKKPYKCDYPDCDKAYIEISGLKNHKKQKHEEKELSKSQPSTSDDRPYKCDYPGCEKAFSQSRNLASHKQRHKEKKRKCDSFGCTKAFTSSHDLKKHKRTHTGEKPFTCDQCTKAFGDSSNLKRHKITQHPEENPIVYPQESIALENQ